MLTKLKTLLSLLALVPYLAHAEVSDIDDVQRVFCRAMDWIYTFALIIGIIYIIFAAVQYMSAGGDAEKVGKAHKALIYGAVGIGVAILARGVPVIIGEFIGVPTTGVELDPCP